MPKKNDQLSDSVDKLKRRLKRAAGEAVPKPADLAKVIQIHANQVDAITGDFNKRLEKLIKKSSTQLAKELEGKLTVSTKGMVVNSAANLRTLNEINVRFGEIMDKQGYGKLVNKFTTGMNGQFVWFDKVLEAVRVDLPKPIPAVTFSKADIVQFQLRQASAVQTLSGAVDLVALQAKQQALQNIGALPVKELTKSLAARLGKASAETTADTAVSQFYRSVTAKGYEIIQDDLGEEELSYNYEGPLDNITRAFCQKKERQSRAGETWTRKQIDKMDNGQLPDVFVSCGGYNCRHQWVVSVNGLKDQLDKLAAPPKKQKKKVDKKQVESEIQDRKQLFKMQQKGKGLKAPGADQLKKFREELEKTIKGMKISVENEN